MRKPSAIGRLTTTEPGVADRFHGAFSPVMKLSGRECPYHKTLAGHGLGILVEENRTFCGSIALVGSNRSTSLGDSTDTDHTKAKQRNRSRFGHSYTSQEDIFSWSGTRIKIEDKLVLSIAVGYE
jgi:hypothetical protein